LGQSVGELGRSQPIEPSQRRRAISLFNLWAKGLSWEVIRVSHSVAYQNIMSYKLESLSEKRLEERAGRTGQSGPQREGGEVVGI